MQQRHGPSGSSTQAGAAQDVPKRQLLFRQIASQADSSSGRQLLRQKVGWLITYQLQNPT